MLDLMNTKYEVHITSKFKKNYKLIRKQHKDIEKLIVVVEKLANGEELDSKYKNHNLKDDKYYKNCKELHIEPDWLLIYQINNNELILLLVATGSHSDLLEI